MTTTQTQPSNLESCIEAVFSLFSELVHVHLRLQLAQYMFLSYLICVHRCYVFNKTLLMQLQLFNSENKGLAIALLVTHIFLKHYHQLGQC
jgi:hypothetical protein